MLHLRSLVRFVRITGPVSRALVEPRRAGEESLDYMNKRLTRCAPRSSW
ncbi:hypothetical protein BEI_2463 [Halomonas beimenensis]|uniref:Uncharacterized protein n=1 Tax=Halomonas beimenensis TaxID=475662 RepID=A0A291P981_9GAMM|nr:hypothetical protein BEI_2463 [Halomonas beimenensis]